MTADIRIALVPVDRVQFHSHNIRRDLGDLRSLADSIAKYGVMQPIVVERRGETLRIRSGHRRVAAARLIGLGKIPAVIHPEPLDDDEWIAHAVQENVMRRGLDEQERNDAARALLDLGCTVRGVAETFGVNTRTVHGWLNSEKRTKGGTPKVPRSLLRNLVGQLRGQDHLTASDVLDAVERLLETGRLGDALGGQEAA